MFNKKEKYILTVEGMKCNGCIKRIKDSLKEINDIKKIDYNLEKKQIILISNKALDIENIKNIINNLGYKVNN